MLSNFLSSMNAPNKIFWIIRVFLLFMHLLPFISPDNQEFAVVVKEKFLKSDGFFSYGCERKIFEV
jgi:hypothetical protein